MRRDRGGGPVLLLAALLVVGSLSFTSGCARLRLHQAMERVNEDYVRLFYDIETAGGREIRDSAWALADSLAHPNIAGHSSDGEYQRLLEESRGAAGRIVWESEAASREPLLALRSRLFQSCQACHEVFRR